MSNVESWLALGEEPALEPELAIIDAHHHLWDRPFSERFPSYFVEDCLRDMRTGHHIVKSVFIECRTNYREGGPEALQPVGETEWVNASVEAHLRKDGSATGFCAGIVGHADLTLGAAVDEVLEAHLSAAPSRFRGIRQSNAWDPDENVRYSHLQIPQELLRRPAFRAGFARLRKYDLSFDAWMFHPQLVELIELARAYPDTPIILDHFGGPLGIGRYAADADAVYKAWARDIDELARCENVVIKLGGFNMEINGFHWDQRPRPPSAAEIANAQRRYYLHAIERFAPRRCIFESNFPVDKLSCSYAVQWNTYKRIAADAGLSAGEKAAMFHDNAARVYRLA